MKKYKVVLLPKAQQELEEAVLWYEEQQANIGIKLIECFENALKTLESSSEIFVRKHKQYRELLIPIFPYLIVYRVEEDMVYIVSFFHVKRNVKKKYTSK
jgi:plasmid stabilization system protein ParE